jgi:hypothetical protein
MQRSRSCRFSIVALVVGLVAACAGNEGISSPPPQQQKPPLLVSTISPTDRAQHVDPSGTVVITFSRGVQPASVTSTSVTVGSAEGSLAVSGETVTFTPAAPLTLGTDYQVRVQGVRDVEGTGMSAAFASSFTTRSAPICIDCPATGFARADVEPQGKVVQTATGFTVDGSLSVKTGDSKRITFLGANVDVRFDPNGQLQSISGKVQIPSPHERITFADPVRADVGLFTGRFLNQNRDLGILLKDDTDYFVFDFATALSISIATGATGGGATKPVVVRDPGSGGRMIMIVDYRDPMYYVYGSQDLIGAAGTGWSLNGRIPFVPKQQVAGLGAFDGGSTRTGTFPVLKILSVTGQMVDNETTELHLSQSDPFASNLRAGYQAGFNGKLSLDLFLKDILGAEIEIAEGSGGVKAEASTQTGFNGYAFARGKTTSDGSWWPTFIPARPVAEMDVQARIESSGSFKTFLGGEFGWDLPTQRQSMSGSFEVTEKAMTLAGAIRDGTVDFKLKGVVTAASTAVLIEPPAALLQGIHGHVNDQVLTQIAAAQKAYEDLQKATNDYEFELSMRGVRELIPGIIEVAKAAMTNGIGSALKEYEKEVWWPAAKLVVEPIIQEAIKPYVARMDALAAAARAGDNDATRKALDTALRLLAANKTFMFTYTAKVPLTGIVLWSVTFSRRILADDVAAKLIAAADNLKYIPETSAIKIRMQEIYNLIPDRLIFEQVRDDIQNGLLVMRTIGELGFVFPHAGQKAFNLYVVIDGKRHEVGSMQALTVESLVRMLTDPMIQALRTN